MVKKEESGQLKYEIVLHRVLSENLRRIYAYGSYIDIVSEAI